jgi:hypothetical protein
MITGGIMRISNGANEMNVVINENGKHYEVVDVWTTIDGQWYVSESKWSIPQWAVDEYAVAGELGGAHHFFVRILDKEGLVDFDATVAYQNSGYYDDRKIQAKDGFANIPYYNVFYPDQGQSGGWEVGPVLSGGPEYLVQCGGLPYGLHVTTFAVLKPKTGNGNGNGEGHRVEVWLPVNNTTIELHTNGHDFKMEVTE